MYSNMLHHNPSFTRRDWENHKTLSQKRLSPDRIKTKDLRMHCRKPELYITHTHTHTHREENNLVLTLLFGQDSRQRCTTFPRNVRKQHEELESNKTVKETNLIYFLLEWRTPTAGFHKDSSNVVWRRTRKTDNSTVKQILTEASSTPDLRNSECMF